MAPPDPAYPSNSAPALSHLLQEAHGDAAFPVVCLFTGEHLSPSLQTPGRITQHQTNSFR